MYQDPSRLKMRAWEADAYVSASRMWQDSPRPTWTVPSSRWVWIFAPRSSVTTTVRGAFAEARGERAGAGRGSARREAWVGAAPRSKAAHRIARYTKK